MAGHLPSVERDEFSASQTNDSLTGGTNLLSTPYLLFLGDCIEPGYAKTAFGLRDWAGEACLGEFALPGATVSTGLDPLTPAEAAAKGAKSMVIGIANSGGRIPPKWIPALEDALASGLDLVSGMHARLSDFPAVRAAAERSGSRLIDVRRPPSDLPVATGQKRSGKRLLTVGTDCALGKKYTALAIDRAFSSRGIQSSFRATGQTGIMIAGRGIPIDSVVADFAAGAVEALSPNAPRNHWDVIEGQGSLFHPAYSSVSLALLHGGQPDVFVVCHDPARRHVLGHGDFPLPTIEQLVDMTVRLGQRTNPAIRCGGVSLNTACMSRDEAEDLLVHEERRLGMPVADPMRGGAAFERLVDNCLGT